AALQAHYRPTAADRISVVLIEARRPSRAAPPVLTRGPRDSVTGRERGVVVEPSLLPPYPTLTAIEPPDGQIAARLGDTIALVGHHLDGTSPTLRLEHPRLETPIDVAPLAGAGDKLIEVTLPDSAQTAADWPAGWWSASVTVQRPGDSAPRSSNSL